MLPSNTSASSDKIWLIGGIGNGSLPKLNVVPEATSRPIFLREQTIREFGMFGPEPTINANCHNEWALDPFAFQEEFDQLVSYLRFCVETEPAMLGWISDYADYISQFQRNLLLANSKRHSQGKEPIPLDPSQLVSLKQAIRSIEKEAQLLTIGVTALSDMENAKETVDQWVVGNIMDPIDWDMNDEENPPPDSAGDKTKLFGIFINKANKTVSRFITERQQWVTADIQAKDQWLLMSAIIVNDGTLSSTAYANAVVGSAYRAEVNRGLNNRLSIVKLKFHRRELQEI